LTGVDDRLDRGGWIIGDGVRVRATEDRNVSWPEQTWGRASVRYRPGLSARQRNQRQRRLVGDPKRPRRVHARAQNERLAGARAVE
jgi:hypothetical protein